MEEVVATLGPGPRPSRTWMVDMDVILVVWMPLPSLMRIFSVLYKDFKLEGWRIRGPVWTSQKLLCNYYSTAELLCYPIPTNPHSGLRLQHEEQQEQQKIVVFCRYDFYNKIYICLLKKKSLGEIFFC
jgi:hypothetical protein